MQIEPRCLALAAVHRELGVAQHLVAFRRVGRKDRKADRGGEGDRLVAGPGTACANTSAIRSAKAWASCGWLPDICNPRNSSPLWRARNSPGPSTARIRSATSISSRSPALWPNTSLTSLKPSMSIENAASLCALLVGLGGVERQPLVERDAVRQAGHGVVERQLMDAVGGFGARAQIDDVGRKAAAHHQQHGADHARRRASRPGSNRAAARPTASGTAVAEAVSA